MRAASVRSVAAVFVAVGAGWGAYDYRVSGL